jgi:hypothetical protein
MASRRQEREVPFHLIRDGSASPVQQCLETAVKAELPMLLADEVDDGQVRLSLGMAQASAKLLGKDRGAVRGSEKQDSVYCRYIDSLAEHVDGEDAAQLPSRELSEQVPTFILRSQPLNRDRRHPGLSELASHVARVCNRNTEPEPPHALWFRDYALDCR